MDLWLISNIVHILDFLKSEQPTKTQTMKCATTAQTKTDLVIKELTWKSLTSKSPSP